LKSSALWAAEPGAGREGLACCQGDRGQQRRRHCAGPAGVWRRHDLKPRAPSDPADVGRHRPQNHIGQPAYAAGAPSSARHDYRCPAGGAGFQFDPRNPEHRESGNASRYTLYRLPYTPIAAGQGILRPEIQIETTVWPLRLRAIERPVISFVAEACRTRTRTSAQRRIYFSR